MPITKPEWDLEESDESGVFNLPIVKTICTDADVEANEIEGDEDDEVEMVEVEEEHNSMGEEEQEEEEDDDEEEEDKKYWQEQCREQALPVDQSKCYISIPLLEQQTKDNKEEEKQVEKDMDRQEEGAIPPLAKRRKNETL